MYNFCNGMKGYMYRLYWYRSRVRKGMSVRPLILSRYTSSALLLAFAFAFRTALAVGFDFGLLLELVLAFG